jgi:hypothetical protein
MHEKIELSKILVSKRDAAFTLSLSIRTIENLIARKELIARRVGRRTLVAAIEYAGFNANNLSVDTDASPYEALKEAIYDGRLLCYDHPRLAMPLATVRKDDKTGKIDHPPHGQKDISDSLAGAVWHAEKAFAEGVTGQWNEVRSVTTFTPQIDDSELLWEKVYKGIPLNEAEIARLK